MSRIVIIGAGHGGTQAAASLREESFVGEIVLISEEDDLPYHKPPLSKSFMRTADAQLQPLRAEAFFTGKKITPKSVVREIRTLRSVGAGGGRLPPATRWAAGNSRPYRERHRLGASFPSKAVSTS
jgi:3-phenylpropionate/trans-cinnamate dioxygenase ferredoxin reductase subunit